MQFCKYVNVFQGTGETDIVSPEGLAARWFFIKAGCGNTSPAACVPFGAMSVSPYTGGYPTGYGDLMPNSHSHPNHFENGKKLLGFGHLQQSGTGAMGHYYNFLVVAPETAESFGRRTYGEEKAEPGYYSCVLDGIKCEVTASHHTALHRFSFTESGGKVTVDLTTNGLQCPRFLDEPLEIMELKFSGKTAFVSFRTQGIDVFAVLKASDTFRKESETKLAFDAAGNSAELTVSFSLRSFAQAEGYFTEATAFDDVKAAAARKWENALSKIKVDFFDKSNTEIFYSNLYHSFVKPADRQGESFLYPGDGPFSIDLNTLWDIYKTAVPLLLMTDREQGQKLVQTLLLTGEALGVIPNSLGVTDHLMEHSGQARMLGSYVLLTAYRYGYDIDVGRMLSVIKTDVFADDKKDFTVDGVCDSHTWMLDMADCCALTAEVARENGDYELAELLLPLSRQWKKCYDPETGLLSADSSYYEGTLYNYSFRQMVDMEERIRIAGGNERFVRLMDDFFGYGAPPVRLPTDPNDYTPVQEGMMLGRFEGFNNESDIEAPYSYIYAGRHDRTCEILRAGMKNMFKSGRGGLPGNNDTGALSSYYVFACLGIYPVAGQDLFLFGSPIINSAEIELFNGNVLKIKAENNSDSNIYVKKILFNSVPVEGRSIKASRLLQGGELVFEMSDKV